VAGDLRQGLVTLPALYYLDAVPRDPEMEAILSGNFVSDERMDRLVAAIRKSGAIHQAMDEAREFVNGGLEILKDFPPSTERTALEDLTTYIVDRRV
jgi:geranylgeranyl pyrophosphate synthase